MPGEIQNSTIGIGSSGTGRAAQRVDWRFILCESPLPGADPGQELKEIAWLKSAKGRNLNIAMARAGDLGFSYHPLAPHADILVFGGQEYCISARRNGEEVWTGPLASNDGQVQAKGSGSMSVKAVGWLEELTVRELQEDVVYDAINEATGGPWYDYEIVADLIQRTIDVDPLAAPRVRYGQHYGQPMIRQMKWSRGTKIEQCLRDLQDVESGLWIDVHPTTRRINSYAWDWYNDRPELVFGYNKPPNNIAQFGWKIDHMTRRNRIFVQGPATMAPALVEDEYSQQRIGRYEETITIAGNVTQDGLLGYAGAELLMRKNAMIFFNFTPKATDYSVPAIFEQFYIGDRLRMSIDYGPFDILDHPVRMFGVGIGINDNGTETLSSVQTTASGG